MTTATETRGLFGLNFWPFYRGPAHCSSCGDAFVRSTYYDGFRRDGSRIVKTWSHCPRSDDRRPFWGERYQVGRCHGMSPFACANERRAYAEHRPAYRACPHHSVSESGDRCWAKDGTQLTGPEPDPTGHYEENIA